MNHWDSSDHEASSDQRAVFERYYCTSACLHVPQKTIGGYLVIFAINLPKRGVRRINMRRFSHLQVSRKGDNNDFSNSKSYYCNLYDIWSDWYPMNLQGDGKCIDTTPVRIPLQVVHSFHSYKTSLDSPGSTSFFLSRASFWCHNVVETKIARNPSYTECQQGNSQDHLPKGNSLAIQVTDQTCASRYGTPCVT